MALGIENSISDTAKAFQGNPAALQQRYAQKQDLFDLLALNMIRKEQDAAKRGLLLSQQQMPGTILEQMEGAVTKNVAETAEGVKGALDTKNAQSKANMSKMAGVSGAPAGNMRTLAGGGVVGFAAGKEVEGNQPTDAELKMVGLTRDEYDKLDKADKYGADAIIEKNRTVPRGVSKELSLKNKSLVDDSTEFNMGLEGRDRSLSELQKLIETPSLAPNLKTGLMKTLATNASKAEIDRLNKKSNVDISKTGLGSIDQSIIADEKLRQQGQIPSIELGGKATTDDKKSVVPGVGVDSFSADKSGGVTAAPAFDASKFAADGAFNQKVKGGIKDLIDSDPQKAVDFAARTPSEQAFIAKMLQERTDMRANMMDPDKLSNDRLMQTLLGAKGATAGEAFRTSGLAGINAERNQEKLKRDEFDALNKLYMTEADRSQTIKKDAFKDSLAAKKQGVASGTSLTTSEKSAALEADKLVATISNNAVQSSLKKDLNDIQKQRNSILESGNVITGNTKMVQLYENAEAKGVKTLTDNATKQKASNFGSDKAEKDKKIDAELAANIKKLRDSIKLKVAPFRNSLKKATTSANTKTGGMTEVDKILGIK